MTRAYNTATTQQNSGGAVVPFVAGKNFVINGGFDVWQRGTSFSGTPYNGYTADRWVSGSDQTVAITRQTTGVPSGQRYCIRNAVTSGTGYVALYQTIETANVIPMQGKIVTLSVKLRRSSGYSGSMTLKVQKNNSVDISSGGWTDITGSSVIIANSSLPTGTTSSDWYTATTTFTIPDDGTALTLRVAIEPNAGYTSSAYWEASSVQLEIGSVVTTFTRAGGNVQGEVAACYRYYETGFQQNQFDTSGKRYLRTDFKATKRGVPSISVSDSSSAANTVSTKAGYLASTTNGVTGYYIGEVGVDGFNLGDNTNSANFGLIANWQASADI